MSEQKQKKTGNGTSKKHKKAVEESASASATAQESPVQTSGDLLRAARLEKNLNLEEISATINVRVVQLKAIEDGHIDQLPGMTYALGFVKSYAALLKLDPAEIVEKFKAEHSDSPAKPELNFPEPIAESKMPDPIIMGIAAMAVVALLVIWAFFSGGTDDSAKTASNIPPPPSGSSTLLAPTGLTDTSAVTGDVLSPASTAAKAPPPGTSIATGPLTTQVTPLASMVGSPPQTAPVQTETPAPAQTAATVIVPPVTAPERPRAAPAQDTGANVINVRRGRSRITLKAHQSTWVQISDASQATIFKKVLRPGDEYFVPDQSGLTMVTSNAGGIDVIVDGKKVQPLGKAGEIIRGIELDPNDLKTTKVKTRY